MQHANHTQSDKGAGARTQSVERHDSVKSQTSVEPSRGTTVGDVPGGRGAADSAIEPRIGDGTTKPTVSTQSIPTVPSPLAQMHALVLRAGEDPFSDKTSAILSEPISDDMVDVRPEGNIYVSHPHYRSRLDRAFGVGGWCLVPLAPPRVDGFRVQYYGFLKAAGRFISDAVGGANYVPKNPRDSYDNAVEKAKSDCLVRCCKQLPMFRQCWDKQYADYWLSQYAQEGPERDRNGNLIWQKKPEYKRQFKQAEAKPYHAKPLRMQDNDEYNDNEPEHDLAEAEFDAWKQDRD